MPRNYDYQGCGCASRSGRAALTFWWNTEIAGDVAAEGLRALAQGMRLDMAQLLLTPSNTLRLTDGLSHLRGSALKVGQMLSMDSGLVLSDELTAILGRMRDDARHIPPKQLQTVLNVEWGTGWYKRFARFHVRPLDAFEFSVELRVHKYAVALRQLSLKRAGTF